MHWGCVKSATGICICVSPTSSEPRQEIILSSQGNTNHLIARVNVIEGKK